MVLLVLLVLRALSIPTSCPPRRMERENKCPNIAVLFVVLKKMSTQYFLFHVLNTVRSLQSLAGELAISERSSTHKPKPPEIEHSRPASRGLFYRAGTAVRSRTHARANRDMPVSSFVLGLVFVGLALVAYADRPPQIVPFHLFNGVKGQPSPARNSASYIEPG